MEQVFRACVLEARDHGQTVFLSSHILSEVDAVCDRVAMLHTGRIIQTGAMQSIRSAASVRVQATFAGDVPDVSGVEGVANATVSDHTLECDVTGSMQAVMAVLVQAGVTQVRTRESSLEELFLSLYGDDAADLAAASWPRRSPARRRWSWWSAPNDTVRAPTPRSPAARSRQVRTGPSRAAYTFGATVAVTASSYVSSFPSAASRHELAVSTGRDSGLAVLLGPVTSLETVGGYTVYKLFVFLTTIAALWSLLAATRLLRGEEDAGRWQIVLAGNTGATRTTAATLIGLGAAIGVVAAAVSIFTWLAGRDGHIGFGAGDSVVYAASIAVPAAVFAAVGAVTAQMGKTRRVAVGIGVVVIAASFVLRMIADSGSGTRWLAWATPFGWSENVHPFTRNNLVPFLPATLTVVALGLLTIVLAAPRDAGDGIVSGRENAAPREFGLRSPSGLARRLELPTLVAWGGGVFAAGVAFGIVAKATRPLLRARCATRWTARRRRVLRHEVRGRGVPPR